MRKAMLETVADYTRQFDREWRVMVKHVLFSYYGGDASESARTKYVTGRLQEIRRGLTPTLHRPEDLALAEAIEETLFESPFHHLTIRVKTL